MEKLIQSQEVKLSKIKPYINNAKIHDEKQIENIAKSLSNFWQMQDLVIEKDWTLVVGHGRFEAMQKLGWKKCLVKYADHLTDAEIDAYRIIDNKLNESAWNYETLKIEIEKISKEIPLEKIWLEELTIEKINDIQLQSTRDIKQNKKEWKTGVTLAERFIIPPFSIWDTKQGYWMERKRERKEIIGDNWESRENTLMSKKANERLNDINWSPGFGGVSILDPVMAECVIKFFSTDNATAFDPFAGDTVFGFVAGTLWRKFRGIELRQEQANLNQKRCDEAKLDAIYYNDTAENMDQYIEDISIDLLFSCPPYWNLEKYSDSPNDLSNQTKDNFYKIIWNVWKNTYKKMKNDSFAVIVIGEVRDKSGEYINFIGETIQMMKDAWYLYYNEIILATPIGTTAIRVGKQFNGWRKVGKIHQNILVFYKGDIKNIKDKFPALDFSETLDDQNDI